MKKTVENQSPEGSEPFKNCFGGGGGGGEGGGLRTTLACCLLFLFLFFFWGGGGGVCSRDNFGLGIFVSGVLRTTFDLALQNIFYHSSPELALV